MTAADPEAARQAAQTAASEKAAAAQRQAEVEAAMPELTDEPPEEV